MKKLLTIIFAFSTLQMSGAEPLRLLLVPVETSIKRQASVTFDVYLVNTDLRAQPAPSLELLFGTYDLDDVKGARLPRGGDWGETTTVPPSPHVLQPNAIEHRQIRMDIPAEPGDLVKVFVEIRGRVGLRSNFALLFCRAKKSR